MSIKKLERQERRKSRVRFKISKYNKEGKLRLSIFRSNQHIYAQLINDQESVTLASSSSLSQDFLEKDKKMSEKALAVGRALGIKAKEMGVDKAVYDRGPYKFHGVVANVVKSFEEILAN